MSPREAAEMAFYECDGNTQACLKVAFDAFEAAAPAECDELKRHIHYLEANAEDSVSRAALVPELLDALKGLLEVHDAMGAGQSYAATKARAIIAKAEA